MLCFDQNSNSSIRDLYQTLSCKVKYSRTFENIYVGSELCNKYNHLKALLVVPIDTD